MQVRGGIQAKSLPSESSLPSCLWTWSGDGFPQAVSSYSWVWLSVTFSGALSHARLPNTPQACWHQYAPGIPYQPRRLVHDVQALRVRDPSFTVASLVASAACDGIRGQSVLSPFFRQKCRVMVQATWTQMPPGQS